MVARGLGNSTPGSFSAAIAFLYVSYEAKNKALLPVLSTISFLGDDARSA